MLPLRGSSYTHTQSTKIVLRLLFEFGFSSSFCFLIYIFIAIVDCCCSIVKFVAVFCWHSRCFLVENSFISIYNRSTIFNLDCFSLFIHLILSETSFLVRFPLLIRLDWFKEPSSHFISLLHSISRSFSISLFFSTFPSHCDAMIAHRPTNSKRMLPEARYKCTPFKRNHMQVHMVYVVAMNIVCVIPFLFCIASFSTY